MKRPDRVAIKLRVDAERFVNRLRVEGVPDGYIGAAIRRQVASLAETVTELQRIVKQ